MYASKTSAAVPLIAAFTVVSKVNVVTVSSVFPAVSVATTLTLYSPSIAVSR